MNGVRRPTRLRDRSLRRPATGKVSQLTRRSAVRAKVTARAPEARCWTKRVMSTPEMARLARGPTSPMDRPMKLRTRELSMPARDRCEGPGSSCRRPASGGTRSGPGRHRSGRALRPTGPDCRRYPRSPGEVVLSLSVRRCRPGSPVDSPLTPAAEATSAPARWAPSICT